MASKMYAWSNFRTEFDDKGNPTSTVSVGDEVTKDKLGVSDEEWDYLVETGAVREDEYPDIPPNVAPAEYFASEEYLEAAAQVGEQLKADAEAKIPPSQTKASTSKASDEG